LYNTNLLTEVGYDIPKEVQVVKEEYVPVDIKHVMEEKVVEEKPNLQ
jgi:hypothetical protein